MPEIRQFNGRPVKNARRIMLPDGHVIIRITFDSPKGTPGKQMDVTPEDYDAGVTRSFKPGLAKVSR